MPFPISKGKPTFRKIINALKNLFSITTLKCQSFPAYSEVSKSIFSLFSRCGLGSHCWSPVALAHWTLKQLNTSEKENFSQLLNNGAVAEETDSLWFSKHDNEGNPSSKQWHNLKANLTTVHSERIANSLLSFFAWKYKNETLHSHYWRNN